MKLSVLIPAYNLEKYIEETIRSVCEQQTDFGYEVIVCDDASPDGTARIIRQLASEFGNLVPIIKTENGGLAENMKTLLSQAKGEYIAYLDGDDVALPGKLQSQVDYLDNHPECGMVYHESDVFDSDTNQSIKRYSTDHYNWEQIPEKSDITHLVRYGTYLQASSVMFRRHNWLIETVLPECKIILDYPFYIMNAGFLKASIDFIPEVLGRYRIHADSFGGQTQRSVSRRLQSLADIQHATKQAAQFGVDKQFISQGCSHHLFAAALYFLFRENDEQFTELIKLSVNSESFFNERHQLAWEYRHAPQQARILLRE
ncbi:glycosyltransferase family 2 protein [Alteromonas sp. H39]|uniref:glycosyltransferase family 2 protein n=1 Tax=Alteromonas sp. H39 TaxID=3389876 RepID=UPI0039E05E58